MPKHTKKATKPKKGTPGKGTGGSARSAIRAAQKRGCTLESIGKATNRDAGTISQILDGSIKNPPKDLAGKVRACKPAKKRR